MNAVISFQYESSNLVKDFMYFNTYFKTGEVYFSLMRTRNSMVSEHGYGWLGVGVNNCRYGVVSVASWFLSSSSYFMGRKRKYNRTGKGSEQISGSEMKDSPRLKRKRGRESPVLTSQALSNFRVEVRKTTTSGSTAPRYERFVHLKDEGLPSLPPAVDDSEAGGVVLGKTLEIPSTSFACGSNPDSTECNPCTLSSPVGSSPVSIVNEEPPLTFSAYKRKPDPARMRANMSPPKELANVAELCSATLSNSPCKLNEIVSERGLSVPSTCTKAVHPDPDARGKGRRKATSVTWKFPQVYSLYECQTKSNTELGKNLVPIPGTIVSSGSQVEEFGDDFVLGQQNKSRVSLDKEVQVGTILVPAEHRETASKSELKGSSTNLSKVLEYKSDSLARVGSERSLSQQVAKTKSEELKVERKRHLDDFQHEDSPLLKRQKLHNVKTDQHQESETKETAVGQAKNVFQAKNVSTWTQSDTKPSGSKPRSRSLSVQSPCTSEDLPSHYKYSNFDSSLSLQAGKEPQQQFDVQSHHQDGVARKWQVENSMRYKEDFLELQALLMQSRRQTYVDRSMEGTSDVNQGCDTPLGPSRSLVKDFGSVHNSTGSGYRSGSGYDQIGHELSLESQEAKHSMGPYTTMLANKQGRIQASWSASSVGSKPINSRSRSSVIGQSSMGPSTYLIKSESSAASSSGMGSSEKPNFSSARYSGMGEASGQRGGVSPAKCFRGELSLDRRPGGFGGFHGVPASNLDNPLISGLDHRYGSSKYVCYSFKSCCSCKN